MLEVGGAQLCMFMTTWGDGGFPVEADLDKNGKPLRLRIEVGCDTSVKRQRDLEELWFGTFAKTALVSARVSRDKEPVRFLYREETQRSTDSGWAVFAGDESDEYANTPTNFDALPLRDLLELDPQLKEIFRTPALCAFERQNASDAFVRNERFQFGES